MKSLPLVCLVLGALGGAAAAGEPEPAAAGPASSGHSAAFAAVRPVFVENHGQFQPAVLFRTTWPSPLATITRDGLLLTQLGHSDQAGGEVVGHNVLLRFQTAVSQALPDVLGSAKAPTRCSYFLGNDSARWITDVPCWSAVRFDVAPGVSVEAHGRNGVLEYDLLIAPGVSSDDLHVVLEGAVTLQLRSDGGLDITTPVGTIHQTPPRSWELDAGGGERLLESQVQLVSPNSFRFHVAGRDVSRSLVIDPGLGYGTFVEGSAQDYGDAIAVDADGAAFIAGTAISTDFPVTPGAFQPERTPDDPVVRDAVIAKLSFDGSTLEYATYLGGHGEEYPSAIKVDNEGNAYVGGWVAAADFPTTAGTYSQSLGGSGDAFVTILNPTGAALVASTYFGGSAPEFLRYENCNDLNLDALGRVVIGGKTGSADMPVTANAFQMSVPNDKGGYLARLSADLSAVDYCTYVGSTHVTAVAVDASMSLYAAGEVSNVAQGSPVTPGAFQTVIVGFGAAFTLKTNPDGSLAWCTLLSGNNDDRATALEADDDGHAVVAGYTNSFNFPTTPGAFDPTGNGATDGYVAKIASDGASLVFGTRLGGGDDDDTKDLALDLAGNCHVVTHTRSSNFPVTPDAFDTTLSAPMNFDAHVAILSADGASLLYGSYIGGTGNNFDIPNGIAVDLLGNPYITGYTISADFPTTPGAFDTQLSGFTGLFVAQFAVKPWLSLGQSLAGWNGIAPRLFANGSLLPLSSGALHLDQARPSAVCTLLVGLSELSLPFKGGTLVPMPHLLLTLLTSGQGKLDLAWPSFPASVPAGTALWFQAWVKDVDSDTGFTASNALRATVPN